MTSVADSPPVLSARNGVVVAFVLNGLLFASLVSRIPLLRDRLELSNGGLGLLLLTIAAGSVLALPSAGFLIQRWSAAAVVQGGAVIAAVGLVIGALGTAPLGRVEVAALGLFLYGIGVSLWDVAMNVEGAEVERLLGRSIMPRFHAAWSLGSIGGAAIGALMAALHASLLVHLGVGAPVVAVIAMRAAVSFLPSEKRHEPSGSAGAAWLEPRVLVVGVMVLTFAVVEGAANDWLSLALIDGYEVEHWMGVSGYVLFVTSMTAGRMLGPVVLDRFGRAPSLWASCFAAAAGILLVVLGGHLLLVAVGIVMWGLGGSLGFPVGMSTVADDPSRSAARVSVVATVGYGAFLAGPPLIGWLGDHVGTLDSLLVVAALMAPTALAVLATRTPSRAD